GRATEQARALAYIQRVGEVLSRKSTLIMAVAILGLGFFLIFPVVFLLINSFNTSPEFFGSSRTWGLENWQAAWSDPRLLRSLGNTLTIWISVFAIGFPIAVLISWTLARTNLPFNHVLEFAFWISYMMPALATTIGWIMLLDPDYGLINALLTKLSFIEKGPFNIYGIPGIIWVHLMANGISLKVMLLTPAFRNMDAAMEEAARVSGASNLSTMMRITLP